MTKKQKKEEEVAIIKEWAKNMTNSKNPPKKDKNGMYTQKRAV